MPAPTFAEIDAARVAPMRLPDRLPESWFRLGHGNSMNMVGHPGIAPNFHFPGRTPLGHELQLCEIILVAEKSLLPTIPRCVMGCGIFEATTRANRAMPSRDRAAARTSGIKYSSMISLNRPVSGD